MKADRCTTIVIIIVAVNGSGHVIQVSPTPTPRLWVHYSFKRNCSFYSPFRRGCVQIYIVCSRFSRIEGDGRKKNIVCLVMFGKPWMDELDRAVCPRLTSVTCLDCYYLTKYSI